MAEIGIRQAILHGIIAAGVVEALLRTWRIGRADSRIRFWTLALAFPFLVAPAFLVVFPFRMSDAFAARWALFASARWNDVRVAGAGADTIVFAALVTSGLALFLRDVVPFVVEAARERGEALWPRAEDSATLGALVTDLSRALRILPPPVTVVATEAHVFFVRGLATPRLVASQAALARLDPPRLRAAVAHELAHVARRDLLTGWLLMVARLVMCWNPAVQLLARAVVQEMERRADAMAAALTAPEDVSAALSSLAAPASGAAGSSGSARRSLRTLTEHLDGAHIRARSAALRAAAAPDAAAGTRLTLTAVALATVLFFVI